MSTEKRDALARDLFGALLANGARTPEEYQAAAGRRVNDVIAEALRNEAEWLRYLVPSTASQERSGLKWAARQLMHDANTLENGDAAAAWDGAEQSGDIGDTAQAWSDMARLVERYGLDAEQARRILANEPAEPPTPEQAREALKKLAPLLDRLLSVVALENETERTEDQ